MVCRALGTSWMRGCVSYLIGEGGNYGRVVSEWYGAGDGGRFAERWALHGCISYLIEEWGVTMDLCSVNGVV